MRCAGILSLSNFVGGVGACSSTSLVFELYAVSLRLRLFLVRRLILLLNCKSGQTHSTVLRLTRACLTRLLARARFLGLIRYNWPDSAETLFHALTYHGHITYIPNLIYRTRIVVTCISRSREYSVFLSLAGTDLSVGCIKTAAFQLHLYFPLAS